MIPYNVAWAALDHLAEVASDLEWLPQGSRPYVKGKMCGDLVNILRRFAGGYWENGNSRVDTAAIAAALRRLAADLEPRKKRRRGAPRRRK